MFGAKWGDFGLTLTPGSLSEGFQRGGGGCRSSPYVLARYVEYTAQHIPHNCYLTARNNNRPRMTNKLITADMPKQLRKEFMTGVGSD
ncbi:MAG: hypothetical protein BroJett018_49430 [Chloroflexota bacterium]|nr:MAG: hypothetical protein BroJett018_49430 [Chloroflexota bacterium]